ncbi:MAG TPA: ABC transporter permease [Gemmatimonadaceae bacterium]|nr:ABC transporter permease [Gemmatimonadaceae bacterium]
MPARPIRRFLRLPRSAARIRADLDDELRFDIDMRTRDYVAQDLSFDEARTRAVREFGDLDATRRYCEATDMEIESDIRRSHLVEDLRADLRLAWRAMRRTPAFAAVVLTTLALGVGANTAVFSVVHRVLIEPLPYRAPEQLYRLYAQPNADGSDMLSAGELMTLAAQSKSIVGLTAFGNYGGLTYTSNNGAEPWQTASVDTAFFNVLGVRPILGRGFTDADLPRGAPHVVILSYSLWQRDFGGDSRVVGRTVLLNGNTFTVVGVLPSSFVEPTFNADALLPLDVASRAAVPAMATRRVWRAVARLGPGVSNAQLRSELALLHPRIQQLFPDIKNAGIVVPTPLHAAIVGGVGSVLIVVMVGALVVLVVTCVNIASLFLGRAMARRRELGIRTALGAARGRLVRQVLTEGLMYGVVGGALGVALAFFLEKLLLALTASLLGQVGDVHMNGGVLAFAIVLSIACGLAFGVGPALGTTRLDVRDALGDGGNRSASSGRSAARGSRVLVAAQIAFAVVLVVGAGLLARTFVSLVRTNLGYAATNHQATFILNMQGRYRYPTEREQFVDALSQKLHGIPGVAAVGYTAVAPWNGGWMHVGFRIEGRQLDNGGPPSISLATASPEYFAATGVRLLQGRVFSPSDRPGTPPAIVISEDVAKKLWPNASPIGAHVFLDGAPIGDSTVANEVIGVVADVRPSVLEEVDPTVYQSALQTQIIGNEFVVRTSGDARALIATIRQDLHAIDPKFPLVNPRTLRDVLGASIERQQLAMGLMGAFALLALGLAALGVYGIMAFTVVARTREFGIRSALGASRGRILMLVLRYGLLTAAVGCVVGLAGAAVASKLLASMLAGVSAHDPITFVAAPIVLLLVALAASLVPARAATRVAPVEALRAE